MALKEIIKNKRFLLSSKDKSLSLLFCSGPIFMFDLFVPVRLGPSLNCQYLLGYLSRWVRGSRAQRLKVSYEEVLQRMCFRNFLIDD